MAGRAHAMPLADVEHIDIAELFREPRGHGGAIRAARSKIRFIAIIFALGYLVLIGRTLDLTVFARPAEARPTHRAVGAMRTVRASLVDRNGALLASGIETYTAYMDRAMVRDAGALAAQLALIDGLDSANVLRKRLQGGRGQASLGRRLTPRVREAIFSLGLPGVRFVAEQTRYYPRGEFAAHSLGWVNADGEGVSGVEAAFDDVLREGAGPLSLSLDMRVQFALESELRTAMDEFHPQAALGLVTNVRTGEVLAMAGQPVFSPNAPGASSPNERRNRAATDRYELGSVFKPLTLAMAFDLNLATPETLYDVASPLVVDGRPIGDMHPHRGKMSTREILVQSSNKGAALIALKVGAAQQQAYLEKFGLLDAAKIELRESARPYMATKQWRPVKTATIGFGHGITVTPLAFVQAIGALANQGRRIPLTLLARQENYRPEGEEAVSPQAARQVLELMREVVTDGTGRRADVPGYEIAGKTGSAEKLDMATGKYAKDRNISSFVAVFPASGPRYLTFILLDEPKGDKQTSGWETAGWNAAPVTARLIRRIGPVLLPGYAQKHRFARAEEARP